jgi:thymidine phosphorylase
VGKFLLLFLFCASTSFAQSNFAVVSGSVTDPQNLPVAAATISFRASATGEVRQFTTNEFGTITMPMTPGREIQLGARLSF